MDTNTDEIFINCANSGEQDLIEVANGDILTIVATPVANPV
jgi:hypothetical protein